jgi:hypothetical protein
LGLIKVADFLNMIDGAALKEDIFLIFVFEVGIVNFGLTDCL